MSTSELSRDTIVAGLVALGTDPVNAERLADRKLGWAPRNMRGLSDVPSAQDDSDIRPAFNGIAVAEQSDPGQSAPIKANRTGDRLELVIATPPRTKKNSAATLGSQKSPMYKRYERELVEAIGFVKDVLGLPLPDRRPEGYNCRAIFYVDKWGERADVVGLQQGLYDALQAAGVVTDDWVFRQSDGTRVIAGDRARIEVLITPIVPNTQ